MTRKQKQRTKKETRRKEQIRQAKHKKRLNKKSPYAVMLDEPGFISNRAIRNRVQGHIMMDWLASGDNAAWDRWFGK